VCAYKHLKYRALEHDALMCAERGTNSVEAASEEEAIIKRMKVNASDNLWVLEVSQTAILTSFP
jgi:hypothetical protein